MTATDEKAPTQESIVHTPIPLSSISDSELAYRLCQAYWTIGEAIFLMQGFNVPPEEYTFHHLNDHFHHVYELVVREIELGNVECKKLERAGRSRIAASPEEWLNLAPRVGIAVDPRIEQILKVLDGPLPHPLEPKSTAEARKTETRRRDEELQKDANDLAQRLSQQSKPFNKGTLAFELSKAKGKPYSEMKQGRILRVIRRPKFPT